MADRNFEQQVQEQMEQMKLSPSNRVWLNVDAQLRKDKRRRWIFFLLTVGALLGSGTFLLYAPSKKSSAHVHLQSNKNYSNSDAKTVNENEPFKLQTSSSSSTTDLPVNNAASVNSKTAGAKPVTQNNVSSNTVSNSVVQTENIKSKKVADKQKSTIRKSVNANVSANHQYKNNTAVNSKSETVKRQTVTPQTIIADTTSKNTSVNSLVKNEQPTTTQPVKTNEKLSDSTTQQVHLKEQQEKETIVPDEKVAVDSPSQKPITAKRKSQKGWSINAGIADVRSAPIPVAGFSTRDSYAVPLTGSSGSPGGVSGFVINEYSVRSNIQADIGYVIRFPVWKQSWFATGIHYQYSSFHVIDRIRRDTFSQAQNRLVNDFSSETKNNYHFHYFSVPTELQLHIAGTETNAVKLNVGVLHQFRLASTDSFPSFVRSSSDAAFYQPIIQLAPTYEWKTKKGAIQLGWYVNYALSPVYRNTPNNNWWQTGLLLQYWFKSK